MVVVATAVVFGLLMALGALAPAWAFGAFIIIAGAALLDAAAKRRLPRAADTGDRPLIRSDEEISAIIGGIPDPVIVLEQNGDVAALNAPAALFAPALRVGAPAFIGLRMPELIDAIRSAASSGEMKRVAFSERVPVERWSKGIVTPITLDGRMGQGRTLLFLTIHDLTPIHRMEQMRADFVANASHELKTPLATLSGFIDTLQGPAKDDVSARERFLAIMNTQAKRMARLIEDLLSLSRIELHAHIRPQQPTDLVSILRQVLDGLETLAKNRGVELAFEASVESLMIPGDRDELVRVFENLIENALKYGAVGRRVEIAVRADLRSDVENPEAVVTVRDYGPGIAPEHLPRLTERFYRVDVLESRAQGGTGLGLAIVKHIVARHGGRLAIESELGRGALFTVRLPSLAAARS